MNAEYKIHVLTTTCIPIQYIYMIKTATERKTRKKSGRSRYLSKGDLCHAQDVGTYSVFSPASRPKAEAAQRRTITRYFILSV
jgi:hypothetical protein